MDVPTLNVFLRPILTITFCFCFVCLLHKVDLIEGLIWQLNNFFVITLYQQWPQELTSISIYILTCIIVSLYIIIQFFYIYGFIYVNGIFACDHAEMTSRTERRVFVTDCDRRGWADLGRGRLEGDVTPKCSYL